MRTTEEMVLAVHERMAVLQQKQERKQIAIAGGGCAVLGGAVIILIARFGGLQHTVLPAEYSGASLLAGDNVGGYILVALAAFMAGAAITALIRAKHKKEHAKRQDKE